MNLVGSARKGLYISITYSTRNKYTRVHRIGQHISQKSCILINSFDFCKQTFFQMWIKTRLCKTGEVMAIGQWFYWSNVWTQQIFLLNLNTQQISKLLVSNEGQNDQIPHIFEFFNKITLFANFVAKYHSFGI